MTRYRFYLSIITFLFDAFLRSEIEDVFFTNRNFLSKFLNYIHKNRNLGLKASAGAGLENF